MRERSETVKELKEKIVKLVILVVTAKYGSFSAYTREFGGKMIAPARMSLERVLNIAEEVGIKINISIDYEKAISDAIGCTNDK